MTTERLDAGDLSPESEAAAATAAAPASPAPAPPVSSRPAGSPLKPFRHRNFALMWSGGLVSIIGSWMQTVAIGALVISHTGKALWAVLVAAGAFLPIGLLSPVGGALADRLPRRAVLVAGNLVAAAVALVIAGLVSSGRDSPGLLLLLVTVQGCVSALIGPFLQAILPDLVPRDEFLAAVSLNSAQFNLGRVIGPALAGIAVAAFGYPVAFVANAASFLAVVIALVFVRLTPPAGAKDGETLRSSLVRGYRAARGEPACWSAICLIALVAVLASPFIALVPAVAHRLSHGGARAVASATALLTTAQGIGAVTGALLMAPLAHRFGRETVLRTAMFLLPPVLVIYDFAPAIGWATAALFLVGLVYIGVLSGLSTTVQLRAPTEFRGRILGIYLVALGVAYPLGSLVQGPIADHLGLPLTTAAAAVVLLVALTLIRFARPSVLRELSAAPPEAPS